MRSVLFWVITHPLVVIPYQRFRTTHRSDLLTLEDWTNRFSRNVGKNYHYSLRNNPEEHSSRTYKTFTLFSLFYLTYAATNETVPSALGWNTNRGKDSSLRSSDQYAHKSFYAKGTRSVTACLITHKNVLSLGIS
jgi:hypothetical protein